MGSDGWGSLVTPDKRIEKSLTHESLMKKILTQIFFSAVDRGNQIRLAEENWAFL